MVRRQRWLAACAAVAVAALVAGCSSTDSGTSRNTGSGSGSGNDSAGVTDTEIHVGGIVGQKLFADADAGARARFKEVNDAGGINGRKIVVDDVKDDGLSATTTSAGVRSLVQQNKVFALVPVVTTFLPNSMQFINQQRVAAFGFGIDDSWCGSDYTFSFNGCPGNQSATTGNMANSVAQLFGDKTVKGHHIAIIADDGAAPKTTAELYGKMIEAQGGKIVLTQHSIPAAGGAPVADFTPYVSEAMRSDGGKPPEYIMVLTSALNTIGIYKSLKAAGYQGIIQDYTLYDPKLVQIAAGGHEIFATQAYEANTPEIQRMVKAVKAFKPDQELTQPLAFGYWSADLFVQAVQKAGKDLTRSSLVKLLNGGFTLDEPGGLGHIDYPAMHTTSGGCTSVVASDGRKYNVIRPLTCVPNVDNPLR